MARREPDALKKNRPDFVLLASDNRMLKLAHRWRRGSIIADDRCGAREDRAHCRSGGCGDRTACHCANLAGDPDASQINMDLGLPGSARWLTDEFNRRVARAARKASRLLLDVNGIANLVGQAAWSAARYWYAAKYPFATAMIPLYADLMRLIAPNGRSRRVLVLDLDNTMWGGIVGDDGVEGLVLGSGTPLGETYSALHAAGSWGRDHRYSRHRSCHRLEVPTRSTRRHQ